MAKGDVLHKDEWLREAKRLPIGRTERVYHGAERRPNLVVRNLQDRWVAWCHACGRGGVVMKEFVKLQDTPPVIENKRRDDTGPLTSIMSMPQFEKVVPFLQSKHMSPIYIEDYNPKWSEQDKRIVLNFNGTLFGRDVTGTSKSKWYSYKWDKSYVSTRIQTEYGVQPDVAVITEDFFSAAKGKFCMRNPFMVETIACMGTSVHPDLLVYLSTFRKVVVLFDHDKAGESGAEFVSRTMDLLGIQHVIDYPDKGCDPKDMGGEWWLNLYYKHVSSL